MAGGGGFDSFNVRQRAAALTVTMDAISDDGEAGEGDLVGETSSMSTGGSGNDVATGDRQRQTT